MKRHFIAFDPAALKRDAFKQFPESEIRDDDISMIPYKTSMRDRMSDSLSILIPHSGWGAATGGLAGLCIGLFALTLLRLDLGVAVYMLIFFATGAAILGAWIWTPIDMASGPTREMREEVNSARTLLVAESSLGNHAIVSKALVPNLTHLPSGTA